MMDYIFKKLKKPMAVKKQNKILDYEEFKIFPPTPIVIAIVISSCYFSGLIIKIFLG
jgi:hypothetical protein